MRRGPAIVAALLCLCFLAVACDSTSAPTDDGKGKENGKQVTSAGGKDWEVTLTSDRHRYNSGESVRLTLRLTNHGDKPLQLTFPSAKTHDVTVSDEDGRIVWQWSHDRAFAQALQERTVLAGGSLTRDVAWDGSDNDGDIVESGDYEVTGWFTARDHDQKVEPMLVEFR